MNLKKKLICSWNMLCLCSFTQLVLQSKVVLDVKQQKNTSIAGTKQKK